MELRIATICDFAQVREQLLTVASAGITRIWRQQFPAPLGVMVAMAVELTPGETSEPHEIRVRLEDADGKRLAEVAGAFAVEASPKNDPGELIVVPFVANLSAAQIPAAGRYQVVIEPIVDGMEPTALSFRAEFPSDAHPG